MNSRRNTLLAAAKLTVALNEVVTNHKGRQVGISGKMAKPIQDKIISVAKVPGFSHRYMQRGAGQFVHSPGEFSKGVDIANG